MAIHAWLLIGLLAGADEAPEPDPRPDFTGKFLYAGDAVEKQARETAIADATNGVFFVIRGIVGARVSDRTQIAPALAFSFPEGKIRAASTGRPDIVTPSDGKGVALDIDGEKLDVSQTFKKGALVQVFTAGDGVRTNTMTVEDGGRRLRVTVSVKSSKLPHELVYSLTYKRE